MTTTRSLLARPPAPPRAAALALVVGIALLLGIACLAAAAPARADVDDFSYDRWHVAAEIGADGEGRAVARITETITARFPDTDQNRGIVRGIPIRYEGASTHPRDFSVTDETGAPVPFETETEDGFVGVLIGDDSYVHGVTTYVLSYTLDDVILARDDGAADEFYWDLLDFEHAQPIAEFAADVVFTGALADAPDGDARCYVGEAGSTDECAVRRSGATFSVGPVELAPRQGATIAVGLAPGSVVQPSQRIPNPAYDTAPYAAAAGALAAGGGAIVAVGALRRRRRTHRGTIVAQYDVPPYLPPLVAAPIAGAAKHPVPAEIVHLAVSGAIRIEEGEARTGFLSGGGAQPVLRLLDPARAVDPLDQRALARLFPNLVPGTAIILPEKDEQFAKRVSTLQSEGAAEAAQRGYFERVGSRAGRIWGAVALVAGLGAAAWSIVSLVQRGGPAGVVGLVAGALAVAFGVIALVPHRVHTPAGAESREYLLGVREFIRVAEADRLRVLQSYTGAERRDDSASDGAVDVIHLYERLLPYAMLFGLEKEWTRVLEVRYAERPDYAPAWYPGAVAHRIGGFSSTLSGFTGSLSSSVSYTSSSSGGSSGGGFAGGGGGGGFSGGR